MTAAGLDELRGCPECASLLDPAEAPDDVVEATLAELCRRSDWSPWVDAAARDAYVSEVRAACAGWDEHAARALAAGGREPKLAVLAPLEQGG